MQNYWLNSRTFIRQTRDARDKYKHLLDKQLEFLRDLNKRPTQCIESHNYLYTSDALLLVFHGFLIQDIGPTAGRHDQGCLP
jgi:hypothetical protein